MIRSLLWISQQGLEDSLGSIYSTISVGDSGIIESLIRRILSHFFVSMASRRKVGSVILIVNENTATVAADPRCPIEPTLDVSISTSDLPRRLEHYPFPFDSRNSDFPMTAIPHPGLPGQQTCQHNSYIQGCRYRNPLPGKRR